jgi:phosphoribosylformimino-5-aminoimidazole carboxamide ribotide isomerase
MLIIPVIDLSNGLVVHAKQGLRDSYQAVTSVISASAEPEDVLNSLFELYPFKIIYIADLDQIRQTGSHQNLILNLASRYKECEFWLDAGIKAIQNQGFEKTINLKMVLGSENKLSEDTLSNIIDNDPNIILSLDFNETGLIENPYLLQNPSLWSKQLIVMTLNRVGSNQGVDINRLNEVSELAKDKEIYAAGGVRNNEDLIQLKTMGVNGVLIASALHNGAITKDDLRGFT